jgi:hypothetical protein
MMYRLVTGHCRTAANVEREVHVVELDVAATRLATDLVLGVAGVGHRRDIQALTRVVARLGDRERLRDIVAARFLLERRNGLRAVTAEDISGVVVSGVVLALGTCLVGSGNVILVGTVLVVIALVAIESVQEIIGYAALVAFVGSVAFVVSPSLLSITSSLPSSPPLLSRASPLPAAPPSSSSPASAPSSAPSCIDVYTRVGV